MVKVTHWSYEEAKGSHLFPEVNEGLVLICSGIQGSHPSSLGRARKDLERRAQELKATHVFNKRILQTPEYPLGAKYSTGNAILIGDAYGPKETH